MYTCSTNWYALINIRREYFWPLRHWNACLLAILDYSFWWKADRNVRKCMPLIESLLAFSYLCRSTVQTHFFWHGRGKSFNQYFSGCLYSFCIHVYDKFLRINKAKISHHQQTQQLSFQYQIWCACDGIIDSVLYGKYAKQCKNIFLQLRFFCLLHIWWMLCVYFLLLISPYVWICVAVYFPLLCFH